MKKVIIVLLIMICAVNDSSVYAEKAEKFNSKGYELYSFIINQDKVNLHYALVPETSAPKKTSYLIEEAITYNELVEKIKHLTPKDNISWILLFKNEIIDEPVDIAYPPASVIEEIILLCEKRAISLHNAEMLFMHPFE
jgi:hypothetical protein